MKTIVLEEPENFSRTESSPPDKPGPGMVEVAVQRIGICGTDLHAFRGRQPFFSYPRILGHELGVEVVSVGDGVLDVNIGDKCAVEPYLNCGNCVACRRDKPNCCESLQVLGVHVDGGMRERITVPANKLHRSDILACDQLALVEMLGIGSHATDRAKPESGESTLVIGAGPIGLSVIQFAQVAGANLVLLELNEQRAAFCEENFHLKHVIHSLDHVEDELRNVFGGELPTLVFDATGNVQSMNSAFQLVANGGRLTLVGLVQDDVTFHDPEFHRREITLLSSRNSRPQDFTRIIDLMEKGDVDTRPWVTHETDFDSMIDVFPAWLQPDEGVVKAMVHV